MADATPDGAMRAMVADPANLPLPRLRDDLHLLPGPRDPGGAPTWTIFDPVRHRYHRLSLLAFDILSRWDAGTPAAVAASVARETTRTPSPDQVAGLAHFLRSNGLVDLSGPRDLRGWQAQARAGRPGPLAWLLHHYLFIRIPLVRPDRFLTRTWPLVAPLYHRRTLVILGALLALGIYLVARQWDVFVGGLSTFATVEGVVWTAITLSLTKVIHELGHAYTAHRHGCRVPTMGVAFMVLFPVLYTDTTDSWRLTDRKARLAIGVAGIATELALAVLATLLWSFLPDSPLRNAVYIVATASWVTTLLINLSPFMRFDGYYLLSDLWDVPNLQGRAFALARWRLREALFGFGDPMPEPWPARQRRWLVIYAVGTWIYRLMLFLGIAVLVYHFFIKVVGIVLFAVELVWFIGRPLWTEGAAWWRRRKDIRLRGRTLGWLALGGAALIALAVPLRATLPLPAVLEAAQAGTLYAPAPGRVVEVLTTEGAEVAAGRPLLRLDNPRLTQDLDGTRHEIRMVRLQLIQAAADATALENRLVLEVALDRLREKERGLVQEIDLLTLRAPVSGQVTDMERALIPGRWIGPDLALATVASTDRGRIVAYADALQAPRLSRGAKARFHAEDPLATAVTGTVTAVAPINIDTLPDAMLAAPQGGPIGIRPGGERATTRSPQPVDPLYRVEIALDGPPPPPTQTRRGIVRVEGAPMSLLSRAWRTVAGVLIRESAF
jgi:putative peptide zinc metalloprotease protein